MRKSMDFRILRHITFATFLVPFATTGHAQEGVLRVEVERKIDLDVTIEPQIISLVRSPVRVEYQSGPTLEIAITIDREIEIKSTEEFGLMGVLRFPYLNSGRSGGPTPNVTLYNGPFQVSALEEEGYEKLFTDAVQYSKTYHEHDIFQVTHWSKTTPAGPRIGTAISHVKIHSDARIDYASSVFRGAFDNPNLEPFNTPEWILFEDDPDGIAFEIDVDPPADAAQFEAVAQQYEEYKAAVRSRLSEVLSHLNEPRRLLNDEETEELFKAKIGETLSFSKTIKFDWFGEQKTVHVVVAATVADIDDPDGPTGQPTDFFESDEGWPYFPDVGDEWGVVP